MNASGRSVSSRLTRRHLLQTLTATLIVVGFVLFWGFVWIFSIIFESLSWVLWASVLAPVVFWVAYMRTTSDIDQRPLVTVGVLALAVSLWVWGGVSFGEWGSDRVSAGNSFAIATLMLLITGPVAVGATVLHSRLTMSLAAVLLGQAMFVAATIVFPDPTVIEDGIYSRDNIATADRILIVILGGVGALLLVGAGTLLRRHISPWVTWPGAAMFFLTAVIYQAWYPPFSTFGD